jgi:superfamily II DNA/RNA helicase
MNLKAYMIQRLYHHITRPRIDTWRKSTNLHIKQVDYELSHNYPIELDRRLSLGLKEEFSCDRLIGMQATLLEEIDKDTYRHLLVHYPTGSGKSLFLLAGILNGMLKCIHNERNGIRKDLFPTLVIVPTMALLNQYSEWTLKLLKHGEESIKDKIHFFGTNQDSKPASDPLVIIGTPNILIRHDVKASRVIMDEIDLLLDPLKDHASASDKKKWLDSPPTTVQLLKRFTNTSIKTVGSSATINRNIPKLLAELNVYKPQDRVLKITTNHVGGVSHYYYLMKHDQDNKYGIDFQDSLDEITPTVFSLWDTKFGKPSSFMVFVSKTASKQSIKKSLIEYFTKHCTSRNVQVVFLDGKTPFLSSEAQDLFIYIGSEQDARGLDLPWVAHVIMLGLPTNSQTYIHISGRLGRISQKGSTNPMVVTLLPNTTFLSSYNSTLKYAGISPIPIYSN